MCRKLVLLVIIVYAGLSATAQSTYLNRPDLMALADSCLKHTYNFSFQSARQFQQTLLDKTPDHPAPYFLHAMILYWEYFPLVPKDTASDSFVKLMDRSVDLAQAMIETDDYSIEGVFFDLFGRAFKAMYWADNGKSAKVIPDLRTMYRHTREGFKLKDEFIEFYFSTGLYNYYIEAYPEAHPVYKPLVSFMEEGNRKLGLVQLNHAINHTVFLRVESLLFMSIIQLKYENDLKSAVLYAERLCREYPRNIFYQGHLVTILLHQYKFERVRKVLERMVDQEDVYSEMIRQLSSAFMEEKEGGNDLEAGKRYLKTIDLADSIGPFADLFKAMGYMGLSRLHEARGMHGESKKYARKAANLTVYSYILNEKGAGS